MKNTPFLLAVIVLALAQTPALAAPVDIPSSLKGTSDGGQIQVGGQGEWFSRKINPGKKDKISGQAYVIKASVPLKYMGQWDLYGEAGTMNNVTSKANINGQTTKFDLKGGEAFLGGAGVTWKFYELPDMDHLSFFTDVKYRQMFSSSYDRVTIEGNSSKSFDNTKDAGFQEWQAALGVGARYFDSVVPYAGVTYSDVRVKDSVTVNGTNYRIDSESSRNKVGGVVGLEYSPKVAFLKSLSLDAQARFGDENAYTGAVVWRF